MTAINEKAPGFDRSALTLRQRHPIFVEDLLDAQRRAQYAICGVLDQREQRIAGRSSAKWAKTSTRPLPSSNAPTATGEGSKVSSSARAICSAAASPASMVA
jgi:hypothetical protein